MRFITLVLLFLVNFCYAEKLSLMCNAFDYEIQPEFNKPLKSGEVRFINQTLAGFLNSDDYSIGVTQECEGKKEQRVCLAFGDTNYCPKPKEKFKFKEIGSDGSLAMISDRCDGSWTKYQLIGEKKLENRTEKAFMEYQTFFNLGIKFIPV